MKSERNVEVRLNTVKTVRGSWLLANYPNEFEAGEAASKALSTQQAGAKFAFVIVTTTIAA